MPYPKGRAERDATPAELAEFVKGGCLDYARALVDEGGGKLYVVTLPTVFDWAGREFLEHFLVRRGDLYYDVFGAHTRKEVLAAWHDILGRHRTLSLRIAKKVDHSWCDRDGERYQRALAMIRAGAR